MYRIGAFIFETVFVMLADVPDDNLIGWTKTGNDTGNGLDSPLFNGINQTWNAEGSAVLRIGDLNHSRCMQGRGYS